MKRVLILLAVLPLIIAGCVPTGAPIGCKPPSARQLMYVNTTLRYCFVYPEVFEVTEPSDSTTILIATPDGGPEITLKVEVAPAEGKTTSEVAREIVSQMPASEDIQQGQLTFDKEPAILIDGTVGQTLTRRIVAVHDDMSYVLTFTPLDKANETVQELYDDVALSFHFVPIEELTPIP